MKRKMTIGVLILAGVLAISTGIGIAAAKGADANAKIQAGFYAPGDGSNFPDETVGQGYCGGSGFLRGYLTPQVAAQLKLTTEQIQTQLDAGKTLAEIGTAQGVSQDQLLQAMIGSYSEHLALMVKDGYLTQTQADTMSQQVKVRLQTVITGNLSSTNRSPGGFGGMMRGWFGGPPQSGTSSNPGYGYGMMGGYNRGMMGRW